MNGSNTTHRRYLMPAAVLALGILSIATLVWTNQITRKGNVNIDLADAIMHLQTDVASAHFRLEDAFHESLLDKVERAQSDLARAVKLCEAILSGGRSESGLILTPLRDPQLRSQTEQIRRMLDELNMIVLQHYRGNQVLSSFVPDEQFDEVCDRLLDLGTGIVSKIERNEVDNRANLRRLYYSIFIAWSGVVVAATTGLWKRESQRQLAETELLETNACLTRQTAELRKHRERLLELVEERTMGLRAANVELQKEVVERRQAEEALRRNEEQYRTLVETMNESLTILDDKGELTYVNDKFCEMLGYPRADLLGRPITDFIASGNDRKIVREQLDGIRRNGQDRCEVVFQTRDGQSVFTMVSPKGIYDAETHTTGCFAVITDITEKITLQSNNLRDAHLTSLGELAAGVAHEINNPINGIINYAQMLCERSNGESLERDICGRIVKEGRRIAGIVRSLLLFARGGNREKTHVPLGEILSNSLDLTGSQLRRDGIEIMSDVPPDLPELIADPQEIQQVFMNVMNNARHALNEKYAESHENKILQIHAEKVTSDKSLYVRVVFHDRGVGIPSGIIHKIREPFFSTKPRGRGTGLGLSISDGIINKHGGKLAIESAEGEFTRVVIDLPAAERNNGQNSYR